MLPEWVWLVPSWLLVGAAIGIVASVAVAGLFVLGSRLYPDVPVDPAERIGGTDRRRREIREYLRAIGEPFAEDHRVENETVAFYLVHRDVAITFDAQAYFRLDNLGVVTVLCEEEMPGWHLGRRLPFQVPEVDVEPDTPIADPIARAFDRLDLARTASLDEVKAAYRDRVKRVHPDHGGDEEEFRRVREAYTTAKEYAD